MKIADVQNTARYGVDDSHLPPVETAARTRSPASTTSTYPRIARTRREPGQIYLVYMQAPDRARRRPPAASREPTTSSAPTRGLVPALARTTARRGRRRSSSATDAVPRAPSPSRRAIRTSRSRPNGRVNIVWHDRRHWYQGPGERNCTHSHIFCEDIRLGDTYLRYSTNGGDDVLAEHPRQRPLAQQRRRLRHAAGVGLLVVGPAGRHGRRRPALLIGWMDSREGNWDTDTEDFYLAKVDFDAVAAPRRRRSIDAAGRHRALGRAVEARLPRRQRGRARRRRARSRQREPDPPPIAGRARLEQRVGRRDRQRERRRGRDGGHGARPARIPAPVLLSPAAGLSPSVKTEIARIRPAARSSSATRRSLSAPVVTDAARPTGCSAPQVIRLEGASDAATAAPSRRRWTTALRPRRTARDLPGVRRRRDRQPREPGRRCGRGPGRGAAAADPVRQRELGPGGDDDRARPTARHRQDARHRRYRRRQRRRRGAAAGRRRAWAVPTSTRPRRRSSTESKARGMPSNVVYVADGAQPMDATLLGGVVARATGMLMLAPARCTTTAATQATRVSG